MKLVRGAWKLLVGIKDFLVLVLMLLFFGGLWAALSAKPNPTAIHDGALVVALEGSLVEQPEEADPLGGLTGSKATKQMRLRDVLRALEVARTDSHVKAVVLDLDRFVGSYPAAISDVSEAIMRLRKDGKKVLAYATGYTDDSYMLAANASEIWVHPLGGTLLAGPGGTQIYYKGLMEKLGVNVHVFKVGKFKSAVEPYIRADMSPEARQANEALYGGLLDQWKQAVAKARPQAKFAEYLSKPDQLAVAAQGDLPKANLASGMIDKIGDRVAFGKRVAALVGEKKGKPAGSFNAIRLKDFIAANPAPTSGDAIGVITVAGEIVDGKAGAGRAGGETVSGLLLKGLAEKKLKALVVRVDSPGGSVMASEQIRQAILQAKEQGLPVVVSMGSLAASGGYWVSTPADMIFAHPDTITGSIGIFGVLPTFEKSLAKLGVTTDGVRTTPLSGQPDVMSGMTPEAERLLQSVIENGYARFINLVATTRKLSPQRVDEIGQGRVWLGGTAHQLGLVDRFGGIDDAIAEAARRAKLDPAKVHPVYLEQQPNAWLSFLEGFVGGDQDEDWADQPAGADMFARIGADRQAVIAQALGDARRLAQGGSVQARCLECAAAGPPAPSREDRTLFSLFLARFGL